VIVWKLENIPLYEVSVSRKRPRKEIRLQVTLDSTVAESVTKDGSATRFRRSVGILLNLVEPDIARATWRSSPADHWHSAFICIHHQRQSIIPRSRRAT